MPKRFLVIAVALVGSVLAACGATPTASNRPSLAPLPSVTLPSLAIPSFAIPSFAIPSFASDPVIEAAFPAEIGGSPVEDITSGSFLALLQAFDTDGQTTAEFVAGMQSAAIDPAAVGVGSGTVNLDGDDVEIQVVRVPGGAASTAIDILVRLDQPDEQPTVTQQNSGGKNVAVATDSSGDVEYIYANGEWAWFLGDATPEQAATIFAAVP